MNSDEMTLALPPSQSLSALPSSAPGSGMFPPLWRFRLELACSMQEMTHEEARAHVMLQQRQCCVVREGIRGPRGGRGKLHYNIDAEWPSSWVTNGHDRFFAVFGLAPEYASLLAEQERQKEKAERLASMYGTGKDAFQQAASQLTQVYGTAQWNSDDPVPPPRPRAEWWHK